MSIIFCLTLARKSMISSDFKDNILEPIEILGLDRFDESAVVIKARTKTRPIMQWTVGREFNKRLKQRFDQEGVVQNIGQEFQIHSLILEDILNTEHRPKLDQLEEYLFVSLKALGYHRQPNGPGLQVEHLSLVMTQDCLLSFQKADQDMFQSVKSRLAKIKSRHRRKGQDYFCCTLCSISAT